LDALESAREEARDVEECLDGCRLEVTAMRGHSATKAKALASMPQSDIIHLATHGTAEGMFFAGTSLAEAKFTMSEVQELSLPRAKLVVLSGCDSFKSDMRADTAIKDKMIREWASRASADGVVGISRGFMAAGALTVVASLWKVDDAATRRLMRAFYTRLVVAPDSGQRDAARALQGAMRTMIAEGHLVVQWAAFVVYGLRSWDSSGAPRAARPSHRGL